MGSAKDVGQLSRAILADKDGIVAVFKVYMDESGTHDHSPVLTVGAYFARPREWQAWTKRWNVAKRPIKIFHSVDCQNLHGEFEGWSPEERDRLVANLLPVIAEAKFPGIVTGIVMADFEAAMQGHDDLRAMVGTPYTACFQWTLHSVLNLAASRLNSERIAFFHESNDYQTEASEAFKYLKSEVNPMGTRLSLTFGDKADYVPLQAADVLAYEGNKRLRDLSRPKRRAFRALDPDESRLILALYDKSNMPVMIQTLREIQDHIRLTGALPDSPWFENVLPGRFV